MTALFAMLKFFVMLVVLGVIITMQFLSIRLILLGTKALRAYLAKETGR